MNLDFIEVRPKAKNINTPSNMDWNNSYLNPDDHTFSTLFKRNLTFYEPEIEGEGVRRRKKRKLLLIDDDKKYKGNLSLQQMIKNLKLRKEKELLKDEAEVMKKQKELFKLLGI